MRFAIVVIVLVLLVVVMVVVELEVVVVVVVEVGWWGGVQRLFVTVVDGGSPKPKRRL